MKIAIASGKGGTGKTAISTNLAWVLSQKREKVIYCDCDVEEPNGHLFLNPVIRDVSEVTVSIPFVDESLCIHCGKCEKICNYSAIAVLKDKTLIIEDLCHSCGGCWLVCPRGAIKAVDSITGQVFHGMAGNIEFESGSLRVGKSSPTSVVQATRESAENLLDDGKILLFDAPPGASCPVVETMIDTDFVILVTEPTPFGLNDLKLAVELTEKLHIPTGIIINRGGQPYAEMSEFLRRKNLPILAEIPETRDIATAISNGLLFAEVIPEYQPILLEVYDKIRKLRGI